MKNISASGLGKQAQKDVFGEKNFQPDKRSKKALDQGKKFHEGDIKSWWYTFFWVISLAISLFFITIIILFQTSMVLIAGGGLFVLSFLFFIFFLRLDIRTRKDVTKLLPGKVVYHGEREQRHDVLRSKRYKGLVGQPDFVYHLPREDKYYVADLKTCYKLPKRALRLQDAVQLAAYYLLLKERYGDKLLQYGYIIYQSRRNFKTRAEKVVFDEFSINRARECIGQARPGAVPK